ncbi:nucleoside hydrolase [Actinokineospora enzanensis]|uniref:nucleoside hydrolase n=1 Tax=Actinokineospora enzanensis TaxID=155975 RepID=UPI00037C1CAF|nr:nucleoside hydrolase [Actinokineospora enzanensis]
MNPLAQRPFGAAPVDVVLDVDTGVDDALALLFAVRHPGLRVRAVTCVAGNAGLEQVVRNTLTVLEHTGRTDIPVAAGADRPLIAAPRHAGHVHGGDGLADLELPPPTHTADDRHAVELLRDVLGSAPNPVTVIALAPLTNLALLLRTYPGVAGRIERIMVMGGSASAGNASPVAEFNTWHDPEAAAIVFGAGVPVTMYGLDVFYQVGVDQVTCGKLAAHEDPGVCLAGRLLCHQIRVGTGEPRVPAGSGLLGDAGAVCAVADPGGLVTEHLPVQVELAPGISRGQTVVDRRALPGEQEIHGTPVAVPRVDVAWQVDARRYRDLFLTTLLDGTA